MSSAEGTTPPIRRSERQRKPALKVSAVATAIQVSANSEPSPTNDKSVTFSPDTNFPAKRGRKPKKSQSLKSPKPDTSQGDHISTPTNILLSPKLSKDTCPCSLTLNQADWIECSECNQWWHNQCTGFSATALAYYKKHQAAPFNCITCQLSLINSETIKQGVLSLINSETINPESIKHGVLLQLKASDSTIPAKSHTHKSIAEEDITPLIEPEAEIGSDNIVILDKLKDPSTYTDCRKIVEEIKLRNPELGVDFAYTLPAGGIAVHCKSIEDYNLALQPWPKDSFGGSNITPHPPASARLKSTTSVVIRNIKQDITDTAIQQAAQLITGTTTSVRRFKNRRTGRFMPIAELTVNSSNEEIITLLLKQGIKIGTVILPCEPKRTARVIRCYNCNLFGHTAYHCSNVKTCVDCAQPVTDTHTCLSRTCTNCQGHHSADSKVCPSYKAKLQHITTRSRLNQRTYNLRSSKDADMSSQLKVLQHIEESSSTPCRQESH